MADDDEEERAEGNTALDGARLGLGEPSAGLLTIQLGTSAPITIKGDSVRARSHSMKLGGPTEVRHAITAEPVCVCVCVRACVRVCVCV